LGFLCSGNTVGFDANNTDISKRINQFLTAKLFNNSLGDLRGNVHLEKSIKDIKYKFEVGFNSSSYLQEIDNAIQGNKNNRYNYQLGFEMVFDNYPAIEVCVSRDVVRFISSLNTSKFITTETFSTIDYTFLECFIFERILTFFIGYNL
jgi:hypothetical protein